MIYFSLLAIIYWIGTKGFEVCVSSSVERCPSKESYYLKDLGSLLDIFTSTNSTDIEISLLDTYYLLKKALPYDIPVKENPYKLSITGIPANGSTIKLEVKDPFANLPLQNLSLSRIKIELKIDIINDNLKENNGDEFIFKTQGVNASEMLSISLTNCTFTSLENVRSNIFYLENTKFLLKEIILDDLAVKTFVYITSGEVKIENSTIKRLQCDDFLKGNSAQLKIEHCYFYNTSVISHFIKMRFINLHNCQFIRFFPSDSFYFLAFNQGELLNITFCTFAEVSTFNPFLNINSTLNSILLISNSIFKKINTSLQPLILDFKGEHNQFVISNCHFSSISIKNSSLIFIDSRKANLVLNDSLFFNISYENIQEIEEAILIGFIGINCSSFIANCKFLQLKKPDNIISQLYSSTLVLSQVLFWSLELKKSSALIYLNVLNKISIEYITILNILDNENDINMMSRGSVISAEIKNTIEIRHLEIKNCRLEQITLFFYFNNLNSIIVDNITVSNLSYLGETNDHNVYFIILYEGNKMITTGKLTLVNLASLIPESEEEEENGEEGEGEGEFVTLSTNSYNNITFKNCEISMEYISTVILIEAYYEGASNIVEAYDTSLFIGTETGIPLVFYFYTVTNALIIDNFILHTSYIPYDSVFIYSKNSKSITITNFTLYGLCMTLLSDWETPLIQLRSIRFEKTNEYDESDEHEDHSSITGHPFSMFMFNETSKIIIANLTILNAEVKHAIFVQNCKEAFTILNSRFVGIKLINEGSLIVSNLSATLQIVDCAFIENSGFLKGLLQVNHRYTSSVIKINRNLFYRNEPALNCILFSRGGAFYIESTGYDNNKSLIEFCGNNFTENSAEIGSAYYLDLNPGAAPIGCINEGNHFQGNQALYSRDQASQIDKFIITSTINSSLTYNKNERLFNITAIDYFNNTYSSFDLPININNSDDSPFRFSVEWTNKSFFIRFQAINTTYFTSELDKKNARIELRKQNIKISFTGLEQELNKTYLLTINMTFQCLAGHFYDPHEFDCRPCLTNTMKLRKNVDEQCDPCNYNKIVNCSGGNKLILKEGYFRTENTYLIFRCKNIKACNKSKCGKGYKSDSFLCSKCDDDKGLTLGWECIDCSEPFHYISFVVSVSFIIFLKAYSVKKAYNLTKNLKKRKENSQKSKKYSVFQLATTNSCLKIINIHLSFIISLHSYPFGALESLMNSASPSWFSNVSWILDSLKFSLECIFKKLGRKEYRGVLVVMFARIIQPVIIVLIWIIYYSFKIYKNQRRKSKNKSNFSKTDKNVLQRHKNIFLELNHHKSMFFQNLIIEVMKSHFLESIVLIALSISYEEIIMGFSYYLFYFDSKEDEKPTHRMLHEPDTKVEEYNELLPPFLITLIVIFGLLVPLYIIGRLKHAKRLSEKSRKMLSHSEKAQAFELNPLESYKLFVKYGYFYYQYKKSHYYYEIFYMLKRVVYLTFNVCLIPLISIHTKYDDNIAAFINFEVILIWIFFLIHSYSKPFRSELKAVNNLESLSAIILLTSYFFSALFFNNADPKNEDDKDIRQANLMFYFGIWALNLMFFGSALTILIKNERDNISRFLSDAKSFLWCLFKTIPAFLFWCLTCFSRRGLQKLKFVKEYLGRRVTKMIEINPLAHWKSGNTRNNENLKERKFIKSANSKKFKKTIENLKLLVKFQRREIKELRKSIENLTKSNATLPIMKQEGENTHSDINESLRINIFHDEILSNIRQTQGVPVNPGDELEGNMNDSLIQEEDSSPNKIINNLNEMKVYHSLQEEGSKEPSFNMNLQLEGSFQENIAKSIEDEISLVIIKNIIGNSFKDYFIKTKLLLKNRFDNILLKGITVDSSPEIFVIFKRKLDFPWVLGLNSLLKLVFYSRERSLSSECKIEFTFQINYNSTDFTKKLLIKYEELDFLKLEKFSFLDAYFLPLSSKKALKNCVIEFYHERFIEPQPKTKTSLHELLKNSFPELFNEDEKRASQSTRVTRTRSKFAKRMGLNIEPSTIKSKKTFFTRLTGRNNEAMRKSGKIHVLRYKIQLNVELSCLEKKACMCFKDLQYPCEESLQIKEDQLKNLLDLFMDLRLL